MSPTSVTPTAEFWSPSTWNVVGAVIGRGLLLIGRSDDRRRAIAIAAPGVSLEVPDTPEARNAWHGPSTSDGWRIADYYADEDEVLIDHQPPFAMQLTSLRSVCELVARQAPEHGAWLADHLERQIRFAAITALRHPGSPIAEERALGVQFMLDDIEAAHTSAGLSKLLSATDRRLKPNRLRRLADGLAQRVESAPAGQRGARGRGARRADKAKPA